jgi:hypothetical protein
MTLMSFPWHTRFLINYIPLIIFILVYIDLLQAILHSNSSVLLFQYYSAQILKITLYHLSFEGKMMIMLGLVNYMKTFVIDYLLVCVFHCFTLVMTNRAQRIKFLSTFVFLTSFQLCSALLVCMAYALSLKSGDTRLDNMSCQFLVWSVLITLGEI